MMSFQAQQLQGLGRWWWKTCVVSLACRQLGTLGTPMGRAGIWDVADSDQLRMV